MRRAWQGLAALTLAAATAPTSQAGTLTIGYAISSGSIRLLPVDTLAGFITGGSATLHFSAAGPQTALSGPATLVSFSAVGTTQGIRFLEPVISPFVVMSRDGVALRRPVPRPVATGPLLSNIRSLSTPGGGMGLFIDNPSRSSETGPITVHFLFDGVGEVHAFGNEVSRSFAATPEVPGAPLTTAALVALVALLLVRGPSVSPTRPVARPRSATDS